jgi:hypothetical protein
VKVIVYENETDPKDPELKKKILLTKPLVSPTAFGEIALMYNDKRTATIVCTESCRVWSLEGRTFKKIVIQAAMQRRNIEFSFLQNVELFSKAPFA